MNYNLEDLGLVDYKIALDYQFKKIESIAFSGDGVFVFCSHPYHITKGVRSSNTIINTDIIVTNIRRGGLITFHYPGQLVVYPILDLHKIKIKDIIKLLFEAVVLVINSFGLGAKIRWDKLGVWIDDSKIASIGLGIHKFCSYHGLAINITRDDFFFKKIEKIDFCGLNFNTYKVLSDYKNISLYEFKDKLKLQITKLFDCKR